MNQIKLDTIDVVNIEERARLAISLGESHFREFKSGLEGPPGEKHPRQLKSIAKDIGEALVAFANADGGELLVGVEDDGSISGVESFSPSQIAAIEAAPKSQVHANTPLPSPKVYVLSINGHTVIYFSVYKSITHIHLTSDGRCVQRRDLETVPMPPEEIIFSRNERRSREYDREFVDGATASDLDNALVRVAADQLSPGMSIEKCLQHLDLAEYIGPGLRLRRAALLLFASDSIRWHPRLQIRILKIEGTELKAGAHYNVKSDQVVAGSIVELVEKGWEALRPQLVQTRLGREARFQSTIMYPELACREALVNAIAHRDFSDEGRGIEIFVFDDRMEVRNPGALLSSISIKDLLRLEGSHQSRNAMVCRTLRELGYMRELGEGVKRMFELMRSSELSPPELESDSSSFVVKLHHQTIYSADQLLWLEQFDRFDLDREQKSIVVLGMNNRLVAPQDIWDSLGIVDTERYRQIVKSLQDLDILSSKYPTKKARAEAGRRRVSFRQFPRFQIAVPQQTDSVTVDLSQEPEEDATTDAPDPLARIWIGNIPFDAEDSRILSYLSSFGTVQNIYVPKSPHGNRGYAFAEFNSRDESEAALAHIEKTNFEGRSLRAAWATPRAGTP